MFLYNFKSLTPINNWIDKLVSTSRGNARQGAETFRLASMRFPISSQISSSLLLWHNCWLPLFQRPLSPPRSCSPATIEWCYESEMELPLSWQLDRTVSSLYKIRPIWQLVPRVGPRAALPVCIPPLSFSMPSAVFVVISILLGAIGMINASPILPDGENNNLTVNTSTVTPTVALPNFNYSCIQPQKSNDSTKWSTREFISGHIPNPITPTPVFYSGHVSTTNTTHIDSTAEYCAKQRMGSTIGQFMCNSTNFIMPESNSDPLWTYASKVFANHTGRIAYAVIGDATVTSTWIITELPTLMENPNVKVVIGLNPRTCDDHCYWKCTNNATECSVSFIFHCFDARSNSLFSRSSRFARFRYLDWTSSTLNTNTSSKADVCTWNHSAMLWNSLLQVGSRFIPKCNTLTLLHNRCSFFATIK